MKTTFRFALIAFAAMSAFACTRLIETPEVTAPMGDVVFSATREALATKSERQADGAVWWSPSEEISVFGEAGSAGGDKFTSTNTAAAATAEFSGTITAASPAEYWAVVPYSATTAFDGTVVTMDIPEAQNGVADNFSDSTFPAIAKSASLGFEFKNICGGIKFSVSRDDITSVTFKGNNGEVLAGKVKVAFDTDGNPVVSEIVDGKTEVTLSNPTGAPFQTGKYYHVTLLPKALDGGFTMTFTTATLTGTLTSTKAQTIKRCVFGMMDNVDTFATWKLTISMKDFAQEFVKGLDVWKKTGGNVDADGVRNQYSSAGAWQNVHFIPIVGNTTCEYYNYGNNQYDPKYTPWSFIVNGVEYSSNQAWEIAIRGLLNMCTAEGEAFLDGMTDRNKAYTLQDGLALTDTPISQTSSTNKWGKHPWYEGGNLVKDGGADISEVDVNFMIKVGAWHVVRSFLAVGANSPLKMIGNYQEFGTASNTLNLGSYKGYISPMRELLVLMRIYKYIIDNNIDADVYTAIKDQKFDFDLYGQNVVFAIKTQWLFSAARMKAVSEGGDGYEATFGLGVVNGDPGDSGAYIDANGEGKGRLTYVQVDKTGMANADTNIKRTVGGTGHPYVTGCWLNDYWLFTVPCDVVLPAGTKIHIKYIARSSTTGAKYWLGQYYDDGEWKDAPIEVIEDNYNFATPVQKTIGEDSFKYNILMKEDGDSNTTVESYFTLTAPTSEIKFRQLLTGLYQAKNGTTAIGALGAKSTTRIAGSATAKDDGTYSSPLIEVVNE